LKYILILFWKIFLVGGEQSVQNWAVVVFDNALVNWNLQYFPKSFALEINFFETHFLKGIYDKNLRPSEGHASEKKGKIHFFAENW